MRAGTIVSRPVRLMAVPLLVAGAIAWISPAGQATTAAALHSARPSVTRVSPGSGGSAGGNRVTITGTHFVHVKAVKFGTHSATSIKVMSSTKMRVTAPKGGARVVNVRVTTASGTSPVVASDHYTYISLLVSGRAVTAKLGHGRRFTYLFAAKAGSHVTFDVTETTLTGFGALLIMYDPVGTYVTQITIGQSPTYLSLTPTRSGTYKLVLEPDGVGVTGTVVFTYAKDIQGGTLTSGKPVTTDIHYAGQQAVYSFAAQAKSHVTFDVTETTLNTNTPALLTVYDQVGTQVTDVAVGATPTYLSLTPTTSGTYKLVLEPYNSDDMTGTVVFTYAKDIQGGTLTSGTPVTTDILYAGQQALYSFAATAGTPVTIDVTETTLNAYALFSVYDPFGTLVADFAVGASPNSLTFTPTETGTYKLVIGPEGGDGATGTVVFTYTI